MYFFCRAIEAPISISSLSWVQKRRLALHLHNTPSRRKRILVPRTLQTHTTDDPNTVLQVSDDDADEAMSMMRAAMSSQVSYFNFSLEKIKRV